MDHRAFPLGELQVEAYRLEDQEDVGEEDRRVDAQSLGGGDGDLGRQRGVVQSSRNETFARTSRYSGM